MHTPTLMAVALIGALMILECDLGRHPVGWLRLLRAPAVSVLLIVPLAPPPTLTGAGLVVEAVGVALGAVVAVGVLRLLRVQRRRGVVEQHAAVPYAAAVLAFAGLRSLFSFGAEHWFPDWLGRQIVHYGVDPDAVANAVVYVSLAFSVTRTLLIAGRARRLGWPSGGPVPLPTERPVAAVRGRIEP